MIAVFRDFVQQPDRILGQDIALAAVVFPPEGLKIVQLGPAALGPGMDVVDLPAVVGFLAVLIELDSVAQTILADLVGVVTADLAALRPDGLNQRRVLRTERVSHI